MAIRRSLPGQDGTLIDVLDRVLDKGIVISAWGRVSVVGLDLMGLEMRVVVASIETHLRYAEELGLSSSSLHTRTTS
jgi:hypothetical protein